MLFLTHFLFGIAAGLVGLSLFSGGNPLIFFSLVLVGSIFPDIDEGSSKINQWLGLPGKIIGKVSKHRGFFHSLVFIVLVVLVVNGYFGSYYGWGLFLGLASHLFLDILTPSGIKVFYPLNFKLKGLFRTGGTYEFILQAGLFLVILVRVGSWLI